MASRRQFLQQSAVIAAGASSPLVRRSPRPDGAQTALPFVDLLRGPDAVTVQTDADLRTLLPTSGDRRQAGSLSVTCTPIDNALRVTLAAPGDAVKRVHLRWRAHLDATDRLLGDAWERAYGDLEWRGMAPDRVMPWYVAASDGRVTHCYGIRTGAAACCFWQYDADGISLWADVRSGAVGVRLGHRELAVADVVCRRGHAGERAFAAVHQFCRVMSPAPRLPARPVYGHNDWYYAYGNNSTTSVLADAGRIVELSPSGPDRPFAVIDDGWQPERGADKQGVGLWDHGNERFPDMPGLAARIRAAGARPGIWMRPLLAPADAPDSWRLPRQRSVLDPTVPAALDKVTRDVARLRTWGFELIKHDYSTYDLMGRWGSQMGATLTGGDWTFAEGPLRTTAEVVQALYQAIRTGADDNLLIGCNTVSHLSAGVFDICRIGDDTSGTEWERVPRMGVNALAFRGVQHGAFYVADPDCVGVTTAIPWNKNRQWLDLLARSGTTLFVSLSPDAMGADQRRDLKAALALAAQAQPLGEPADWQQTTWPRQWHVMDTTRSYDWVGADGLDAPP